jgi:hypothetical protein
VKNTCKDISQTRKDRRLGENIIIAYKILDNSELRKDLKENEQRKIGDIFDRVQINLEVISQKPQILVGEMHAFYYSYIAPQIEDRPYNEVNDTIDISDKDIVVFSRVNKTDNIPVCNRITQKDEEI